MMNKSCLSFLLLLAVSVNSRRKTLNKNGIKAEQKEYGDDYRSMGRFVPGKGKGRGTPNKNGIKAEQKEYGDDYRSIGRFVPGKGKGRGTPNKNGIKAEQ